MNLERLAVPTTVLIALIFPAIASAGTCTLGNRDGSTPTNVQVCFNYGTDFDDVNGGEDLWNTNGARTARGIRAKIIRLSDFVTVWGGADGAYTDKDTGCTPVIASLSGGPFIVRVYSQAQVTTGGVNTVDIRTSESDNNRFYYNLTTNYKPSSNMTCTYEWANSSTASTDGACPSGQNCTEDLVNLAAAAGYTLDQHFGGLHGKTFKIFTEPCDCQTNSPGACACDSSTSTVKLKFPQGGTRGRKFIIAHEMGHGVSILAAGGRAITTSTPTPYPNPGLCDMDGNGGTHTLVSQLWQGKAAHEGFGHFWASAVWNNQSESDCMFAYYKPIDLDQDGTLETNPWVSCVTGGTTPDNYPNSDYMHNKCATPFEGKSTEFDWLRAWANVHRSGLQTAQIANVWDGANPETWDPDAASGTSGSPFDRLDSSASSNLTAGEYFNWQVYTAVHGVDE